MDYSERLAYRIAKEVFRDEKELTELIKSINKQAEVMERKSAEYSHVDVGQINGWAAIHLRRLAERILSRYKNGQSDKCG